MPTRPLQRVTPRTMPFVGVLIITDGRLEYLARMLASLPHALVLGSVSYGPAVMVDDSGDPAHWEAVDRMLEDTYLGPLQDIQRLRHPQRLGLAAAVQTGWAYMTASPAEYVLHLEEDFTYPAPIPVRHMVALLESDHGLAQVVLKRQPWSPEEVAAGGIMELAPQDYVDQTGYVEHSRVFSLNPCVYPRRIFSRGWPASNESGFTDELVAEGYRFAFYGARGDAPRCTHIGARRSAAWTL